MQPFTWLLARSFNLKGSEWRGTYHPFLGLRFTAVLMPLPSWARAVLFLWQPGKLQCSLATRLNQSCCGNPGISIVTESSVSISISIAEYIWCQQKRRKESWCSVAKGGWAGSSESHYLHKEERKHHQQGQDHSSKLTNGWSLFLHRPPKMMLNLVLSSLLGSHHNMLHLHICVPSHS